MEQQGDAGIGGCVHRAALNDHKGPVVSRSELPTISSDKSKENMFYGFGFPFFALDTWKTLLPKLSYRAEIPFCFCLGGVWGLRQKAPNRREDPRMSAPWRVSFGDASESYIELHSVQGRGCLWVDREVVPASLTGEAHASTCLSLLRPL